MWILTPFTWTMQTFWLTCSVFYVFTLNMLANLTLCKWTATFSRIKQREREEERKRQGNHSVLNSHISDRWHVCEAFNYIFTAFECVMLCDVCVCNENCITIAQSFLNPKCNKINALTVISHTLSLHTQYTISIYPSL